MKSLMKRFLLAFLRYEEAERAKTSFAAFLYYSGIAFFLSFFRPKGASIIMYHSVSDDGVFWDNVVPSNLFERQIAYLSRRYEIVPMSRLVDRLRSGQPVPKKWMVITFDDGYRDNFTVADPILRKYGATATVFPTLAPVENREPFYYDQIQIILDRTAVDQVCIKIGGRRLRLRIATAAARRDAILRLALAMRDQSYDERKKTIQEISDLCGVPVPSCDSFYLNADDIVGLRFDAMDIGSHTLTHPNLAMLDAETLKRELGESKRRLEAIGNAPVAGLAYPFGQSRHFSEQVKAVAKEVGYEYAVTTRFGKVLAGADLYALPRVGARDCSLVRMKVRLLGINL